MSRFLILFLFLVWMAWHADPAQAAQQPAVMPAMTLFFGFYAFMVGILALWARLLARRVQGTELRSRVKFFDTVVFAARFIVLMWFGVGLFYLGWGDVVTKAMGPLNNWALQLPATVVGTLPGLGCWMALWWAQYPAERALREQNVMIQFNEDLPLRSPPRFRPFFMLNLRLQILFTAVPLLLILAIHDLVMVLLRVVGGVRIPTESMEGAVTLLSAMIVFVMAPVIVRRVLNTTPLPASPLRDRLEQFCREHDLKYRDILLWQTNHNLGNAAVMGIIPQVRYILMSDLLLETMSDEQIEAVFAHEVGHIVHKHMIWYLVFFKGLMLALGVVALIAESYMRFVHVPAWLPMDLLTTLLGAGGFLLAFGFVSRRFERQADVFAARQMERRARAVPAPQLQLAGPIQLTYVGPHGARIFASALQKVAVINGLPVSGKLWRNWCHGSIATRMDYLHQISNDPTQTHRFDRFMRGLYAFLLAALVVSFGVYLAGHLTGAWAPAATAEVSQRG
ncbi:MAG TPA: M48 family metallopeptidase [Tepidisphaeraceae bacterium]